MSLYEVLLRQTVLFRFCTQLVFHDFEKSAFFFFLLIIIKIPSTFICTVIFDAEVLNIVLYPPFFKQSLILTSHMCVCGREHNWFGYIFPALLFLSSPYLLSGSFCLRHSSLQFYFLGHRHALPLAS